MSDDLIATDFLYVNDLFDLGKSDSTLFALMIAFLALFIASISFCISEVAILFLAVSVVDVKNYTRDSALYKYYYRISLNMFSC